MNTKQQTFQDFLQEYWMEKISEGQTKDQSEAAEENWESQLDVQEVIDLAELWGAKEYNIGSLNGLKQLEKITLDNLELITKSLK